MEVAKHISCSTDDNYAQHCGVMLCSLFENNKDSVFIIHILMNERTLSGDNCQKLRALVEKYHSTCVFHDVDCSKIQGMPDRKIRPLGAAAYYRLLYTSIFDESVHSVLYLDCDIVVNGNIDAIFELELDDYALAAVQDVECYSDEHRMQIPIPYERCMFCSGVMYVNLDFWRRHNVEEKLLYYARKVRNRCLHDQDALNAVFHHKWFRLPPKWNKFNSGYIRKEDFLTRKDMEEYLKYPVIIHFLSNLKPWQDIPGLRYRNLYYKYLALTVWKDFTPQRRENESYYGLRKMIFFSNMRLWLAEHNASWAFNVLWTILTFSKKIIMLPVRAIKNEKWKF